MVGFALAEIGADDVVAEHTMHIAGTQHTARLIYALAFE
jgi:hypothetical protein